MPTNLRHNFRADPLLPGDFEVLTNSFRLHLLATNKSPRAVQGYLEALILLGTFLEERGVPVSGAAVRREHVESFLAYLLARGQKPATAANRYRSLQAFFKWAQEEGESEANPMARMHPPKVPEKARQVLTEEDICKLLST